MIPILTAQLRAFEHVISECEGTPGDEGYRALFGWRPGNGKVFTSFADHPRLYFDYTDKSGRTFKTSAAGKFQGIVATWDDFIREEGPHDFSPDSQDQFAAWLIWKCGAVEDVEAGRLRAAIDKCGGRWASLPSSTVAQPHRDFPYCVAAFQAAGGLLEPGMHHDTAAPAPTPPASIPAAEDTTGATMLPTLALSFLQPLLAEVLGKFSGRAQATIAQTTQTDPNIGGQLLNGILQQIGLSVGAPPITSNGDAVQAVAALRQQLKDTEAVGGQQAATIKTLEDQALDYLHTLTDAGAAMVQIRRDEVAISTASADAASNRKDARQLRAQVLRHVAYIFAALAGALLLFGIAQIVWGADHKVDGAIVGAFILAFGNAGGWYAAYVHFAVGTTESSGAKDMVIGGIATHNQAAKV